MTAADIARAYRDAGLSVIPIRTDGSKAPALSKWRTYSERPPTDLEIVHMFGGDGVGIGVVGGPVSCGLEILDFDREDMFPQWRARLTDEALDVLDSLPHIITPTGGMHVYFRVADPGGNVKLAKAATPFRDCTGKEKLTLVETRGTGGYVVAPGSPAKCHAAHRPYQIANGIGLDNIPTITPEQKKAFYSAAMSLDETDLHAKTKQRKTESTHNEDSPGTDFNGRGSWVEILEPHGWVELGTSKGNTRWRRPGKSGRGWSATTGGPGDTLYIFSSNAEPFEQDTAYSKFSAFTLLEHGGDFSAAARDLLSRGYGKPREREEEAYPYCDDDAPPWERGYVPEFQVGVDPPRSRVMDAFPVRCLDTPPQPTQWLFENLLPMGCCGILAAEPKAGKTWLTFDMAICLASNAAILGWLPACKGSTLFYSPESGWNSRTQRMWGLCYGRDLDPLSVMPDLPFIDARLDLAIDDHVDRLARTIDEHEPRLVVIDPLVSAHCGIDENSSNEIMRVLNPMRDLIVRRPWCSLLVVHHHNKTNRQNSSLNLGMRGSSAIGGWWDTLITLRTADDEPGAPRRVDVAHRDARSPEPSAFELGHGPSEHGEWFRLESCPVPEFKKQKGHGKRGERTDRDLIYAILEEIQQAPGQLTRGRAASMLGITDRRRFNRHVDVMITEGSATLDKAGKLWNTNENNNVRECTNAQK